jgi:positive regulator of sigma E activity
MDISGCFGQKGVIKTISDSKVSVDITKNSACEGCHALDICSIFDSRYCTVDISVPGNKFEIGDEVMVYVKRKHGWKATFLAYLLPFIIMIATLVIMNSYGIDDLIMGITVLLALTCYFLSLFFIRKRLNKAFGFMVTKQS